MPEHKNILIFLTDDHGQWALGCYGNAEIRTPNIDYLAATGVRMRNAFTPIPVCSPARASLFTGRLPSQHGMHDYLASGDPEINAYPWMANETTIAQLLHDGGYQVGLSGKWHFGDDENAQPGFDYWFSLGRDYPVTHGGSHRFGFMGEHRVIPGRKARIVTDYALDFLRKRDAGKPFCLFVGYNTPHSPWADHPERLVRGYRQCAFEDILGDEVYPFGVQNLESTEQTRENPREAVAQYYAAVTQVDEVVGRVMDELEALDLLKSTLVVYTSDHGLMTGQHGVWGKGNGTLPLNMLEESIRVPLVFNHPQALFHPQRRGEFVDHLDLFQTILGYAQVGPGQPERYNYPGRSMWPLLTNQRADPWRQVQFGEYGNLRMIRTHTHKLVRRYPDGPNEFFDLRHDPRETTNLLDDPQLQPLIQDLSSQIEAYFSRYEDPQKSGLRVRELPRHNFTEAWRT